MRRAQRSGTPIDDNPDDDPASFARDWITLWQSELAALAVDREMQEVWHLMLAFWASAAGSVIDVAAAFGPDPQSSRRDSTDGGGRGSGAPGSARTDAAPGPPPPVAASAAGPDAVERLNGRIAELEQRLEDLERDRVGRGARRGAGRNGRTRRS